jgi:Spy/CpxP family protein refolding chaperone
MQLTMQRVTLAVAVVAAILLTSNMAFAQGRGGRGMQALFEGITLTADQQTKVDAINTKYRAQMQELMPNGMQGGPPDESTRKKMDEIREHQTHDIRELLTDDQRKVFDANVATQKKRREEMMKQRQG